MALLNLLEPPRPSLVDPIDLPQSEEQDDVEGPERKKTSDRGRLRPRPPTEAPNTPPPPVRPPASDDGGAAPAPVQAPAPAGDDDDDEGGDDTDDGGRDD